VLYNFFILYKKFVYIITTILITILLLLIIKILYIYAQGFGVHQSWVVLPLTPQILLLLILLLLILLLLIILLLCLAVEIARREKKR
jgi:hypothetical protein